MTQLIKILLSISICLMNCNGFAYEFKNFSLNQKLKNKSAPKRSFRSTKSLKSKFEFDDSPLIKEIEGILVGDYQNIGRDQTNKLLKNYNLGGGVLNFSGFTWHKPMLNYDIDVNRDLAPDLTSGKWIVQDSFTITIEAATLLSNFEKQNLLSINDEQLGAFAGLYFKRTYQYNHFAESYESGLIADFSKLFLSFKSFSLSGLKALTPYEVLKRKDEFSYNAGGLVRLPASGNLGFQGGALLKRSFKNNLVIQKTGQKNDLINKEIRISIENSNSKISKAQLELQADFFNLLKISLLEYSLEYEFSSLDKTYLTIAENSLEPIKLIPSKKEELQRTLRGKHKLNYLSEFIVGSEKRKLENLSSNFSFLLFGSMKKRASEQVKIIKDGVKKIFFKHRSQSVKYTESLFSRIFKSFIFKIFNFKTSTKKRMVNTKTMTIEYEKVEDLPPTMVYNEEQFSVLFEQELFIEKTHRWYHRNFRHLAYNHLKKMTSLSKEIRRKVSKKRLRGPLEIQTKIQIESSALKNFHKKSTDQLVRAFMSVCGIDRREFRKYKTKRRRRRYLRGRLSSEQRCLRKMISRFKGYQNSIESADVIDLFSFKKFIGFYYSKVKSIDQLNALFGDENLFIYGEFKAKTNKKKNFQTFFKTGQFKGLGVVDKFRKSRKVTPIYTNYE